MRNEFTAVLEQDGDWIVAYCPEVPGANGQGATRDDALASLWDAIALILEDRREDGLRGVPSNAERTSSPLNETRRLAPPSAPARLPSEA
jgi:predicted RNase H-like HicB family nuclease